MSNTEVDEESSRYEMLSADLIGEQIGEDIATMHQNDPEIGSFVRLRIQNEKPPTINQIQTASETTKILVAKWFRTIVKNNVVYSLYFSKTGEPTRTQLLVPRALRH